MHMRERIKQYRNNICQSGKRIGVLLAVCMITCSGCGKADIDEKEEVQKEENVQSVRQEKIAEEFENLMEGARELYENAAENSQLHGLEFQKQVIEYLGKKGYPAVDINNQIDMIHAEQVEAYCEKAKQGKQAEVSIFLVTEEGSVVRYELNTNGEEMDAIVSTVRWTDNKPCMDYYHEFRVHSWKYTEKGYFFIEEYHPPGFDGTPGQTGFRVKPLAQELRELNQKYVLPIGYQLNNMLITNWNEQDYSKLNFYGLFELLYPSVYDQDIPYIAEEGAEYQIPKDEFEKIFYTYFHIEPEQIRENADFDVNTQSYRYRPRGLYDCEFPYGPYPEVVSCEELEDGKLKLNIEAVWERKMLDQVFKSELIVETAEDGKIRYVSNNILSPQEDEPRWYKPRLTNEEWTQLYQEVGY